MVDFLVDLVADFLAGHSTTSSGSGKIIRGPELQVQGRQEGVAKGLETIVLNRHLEPHSVGLDAVYGTVWVVC